MFSKSNFLNTAMEQVVKLKKKLKKIIRKMGYDILKLGEVNLLDSIIYKFYNPKFFFIQIGANDGKRFDPIFEIVSELNLSGLVIEPIKEYFEDLVRNYSGSVNVIPINKAIYSESIELKMFKHIRDREAPDWVNGIASIQKEHYKKSGINEKNIIEEVVNAITYDKLFNDYNVSNIDLLVVDTEGYDYDLIKMFPFEKYRPKIIYFEHDLKENVMTKEQFVEILTLLTLNRYKIITTENDCIAYGE